MSEHRETVKIWNRVSDTHYNLLTTNIPEVDIFHTVGGKFFAVTSIDICAQYTGNGKCITHISQTFTSK